MSTIAENLQTILDAKQDIKDALIEKNSTPSGGLTTYADAVRAISTDSTKYPCSVEWTDDNMTSPTITMGGVDITSDVLSGKTINISEVTGNLVIKFVQKYSITTNLTECTIEQTAEYVNYGDGYITIIEPTTGYELTSITVTMGGVDITSTAYDGTDTIAIDSVTGNIVITASCELIEYSITDNLTECTTEETSDYVNYGDHYYTTITPSRGYEIISASVTMGGTDITSTAYELKSDGTGEISIASVTGNIVYTIVCSKRQFTITNNSNEYNYTLSNTNTTIEYGDSYSSNIIPNTGFGFDDVTITMGSTDITSTAYSDGRINIRAVTGNIVINATTSLLQIAITYNLTNCTLSNTPETITYGETYSTTITPTSGSELTSVVITSTNNGADVTSDYYTSGNTTIDATITTPITITIVCTQTSVDAIGSVSSSKSISIDDDTLNSGTYTLVYEDESNNTLSNMDKITEFTI